MLAQISHQVQEIPGTQCHYRHDVFSEAKNLIIAKNISHFAKFPEKMYIYETTNFYHAVLKFLKMNFYKLENVMKTFNI